MSKLKSSPPRRSGLKVGLAVFAGVLLLALIAAMVLLGLNLVGFFENRQAGQKRLLSIAKYRLRKWRRGAPKKRPDSIAMAGWIKRLASLEFPSARRWCWSLRVVFRLGRRPLP